MTYRKLLFAALAITLAAPAVAYAECKAPAKNLKEINLLNDDFSPKRTLYVAGSLPGPFVVYDQNPKTCKTVKSKMTEDQLYAKYGVADELETDDIETGGID